eukprot:scaffold2101_cov64-Skeletonema_marinoi.AAC.1
MPQQPDKDQHGIAVVQRTGWVGSSSCFEKGEFGKGSIKAPRFLVNVAPQQKLTANTHPRTKFVSQRSDIKNGASSGNAIKTFTMASNCNGNSPDGLPPLPPLPISVADLRKSHGFSDQAQWAIPYKLMQGARPGFGLSDNTSLADQAECLPENGSILLDG